MRNLSPLFALCAACAPAAAYGGNAATPEPRTYGAQSAAPSPDYRALLNRPALTGEGGRQRAGTSWLPRDAKQLGLDWIARLENRGTLLGYGLAGKEADGPVAMIDIGMTEEDFESWTSVNGWRAPRHIRWTFASEMILPRVSDAVKASIRVWPASTARTGAQNQALYHGRVELRDGCFFVGEFGKPADKLAWFHAEMGLDADESGYFILRDRVSGQTLSRLGEDMNWGGPASAEIDPETERALKEACGPGEIYVVGSPQASERFLTQHPHLRTTGSSVTLRTRN